MNNSENDVAEIRNPDDIYRGKAGYQQMLGEIRESLYEEIPEARGSIEIFDHVADPDQEIERISQSLRVSKEELQTSLGFDTYDELKEGLNGQMLFANLDDGRYIAVSSGWDPDHQYNDIENLTYSDIKTYARIVTHETLHALDPYVKDEAGEHFGTNNWIVSQLTNSRAHEMFADVGAQDLFLRNGDTFESTKNLIVGYDSDATIRENPRYDNGPSMQKIMDDYSEGTGLTTFRLEGWKDTIEKVSAMRESNNPQEISIAATLRQAAQTDAFCDYEEDALNNLKETLEPFKDQLIEEFGIINYDGFISQEYQNVTFQDIQNVRDNPSLSDAHRQLVEASYDARIGTAKWMEERAEIYPDAARVAASIRHMAASNGSDNASYESVAAPPPNELTIDMLMAKSWLKFQETQDPEFSKTAQAYGRFARHQDSHEKRNNPESADMQILNRRQIINELFEENPELPRALAAGVPIQKAVILDTKNPDDYGDDEYSVAENLSELTEKYSAPEAEQTFELEPMNGAPKPMTMK